ncbi:A disintegrin and metalloproteinase with thrombospondin motifs 9-like [Diadema antillarum]|uniref:A disintegrin and metalloproteinase with thrombospondin motifs 9-like n=1 Tax=Diadema antillarum TaxID=105358 RepID=UPI003A8C68AC
MAHELGHVFNMLHDSNFKCQDFEDTRARNYAVMAPTLNYYTTPWQWSKCSRNQLTEFLDLNNAECLLDRPTDPRPLPSFQPGEVYNISKQCDLVFGQGSTVCSYRKSCKRLWCTGSSKGSQTGCRTQHMPWADGTPCDSHSWCFRGECRPRNRMEVVDGEWGKWGEYGECSRTCGGGVKEAQRLCDNPTPENGGKYCIGRRLRFKSCNTQPCPEGSLDFREKQCAESQRTQFIRGISPNTRFVPKYAGVQVQDRCKLYCRVAGSNAYYEMSRKVVDGTKCGPDTDDICVQGQCRQAGCDHILSSNTKKDECGVCGGDNTSCRKEKNTYNQARHGYTLIVTIPAGANKINIRQYSYNGKVDDDNYLALSNDANEFILNGNFVVSMYSKEIYINKSVLEYSGSNTTVESIIGEDRLPRAVNLYILSVGRLYPPNVTYSFNVPREPPPVAVTTWDVTGPWGACDSDCDGYKQRAIRCVDANSLPVDDRLCTEPRPDPVREPCNTRCEVAWQINRMSECSVTCGQGYQQRSFQCMKRKKRGEYVRISDHYCYSKQRPAETVGCEVECRNYRWVYSDWSQCSVSCNGGFRSRSSTCRYGQGYVVADQYCDQSLRHVEEACNDQPCPEWKTSDWSACSVTCGEGQEHRVIFCYQGDEQVDRAVCDASTQPGVTRPCALQNCPYWATGQWSQCSVTCGIGYQLRAVQCREYNGLSLGDEECSAGSKPIDQQVCEREACPEPTTTPPPTTTTTMAPTTTRPLPSSDERSQIAQIILRNTVAPQTQKRIYTSQWRTGAWTTCSTTCGLGTRERYVSCRDENEYINMTDCDPDLRPPSIEMCERKACPHWRTGDWRECPVTCGGGVTTRYVACIYPDDTLTSNAECDSNLKPSIEHTCNTERCPPRGRTGYIDQSNRLNTGYWRTGSWSPCSATCGQGVRRRRVECHDDHSSTPSCGRTSRPANTEPCDLSPCPSWDYGEWGQCSVSCGGGTKSRVVKCRQRNGVTLSDSSCDINAKPADTTGCNERACPRPTFWMKGEWSPCSATCGFGVKTRLVVCRYEDGSLATDAECTVRKPPSERRCRRQACAEWKMGDWAECSVTCGRGTQERDVLCVSEGTVVNENLCAEKKPRRSKRCRRPSCPTYRWKKGRWSQCSESCGGGVKQREVWCRDNRGAEVSDEYCRQTRARPSTTKKCSPDPCPQPIFDKRAFWVEGTWAECTRTCGAGEQTREVTCQSLSADGWRIPADPSACRQVSRPPDTRRCNMGPCVGNVHWNTGPWNECSKTCGDGVQGRRVECQARHGKVMPDRFCGHPAIKPMSERTCNQRPCPPTSCRDLQVTQDVHEDGDYTMLIQGRLLTIYCHGMASSTPAEYLTLPAGEAENYSEIYPKRLLNPTQCPNHGARDDNCECTEYGHRQPGLTSFSKVRLNVTSLEVITDDATFSRVHLGHFIPYATAGDCYSAVSCPQGRFHLSLNGTGLLVAADLDWATEGHSVSRRILRDPLNHRVSGICGGYCGKCFPDRGQGRLLPLTFHS